jgi:dTDP-4-amino-4,6-dideoxygalactose transaminase
MNKMLPITRPHFDENDLRSVQKCLESGWATQGPMVTTFEKHIGELHQAKYALATTSCTAALHLATLALNLKPGDEVIIPAFTWVTSAHCAEYVGAKAVFCDVDLQTYNICPSALEAAITPATKAVVVVHLFGLSAPMDEILAITKPRGIAIIEDAACAIGTHYKGNPVGVLGDIGCFSFHPRKVITTGEGGMVTTNDANLAKKVASYRNHGATGLPENDPQGEKPYTMATFNQIGFNLRLSDIQAAIGISQIEKLEALLQERKACAQYYLTKLKDCEEIALPIDPCGGHTFQSFVIRILKGEKNKRNQIMDELKSLGIQTRPGTHAVHNLGYYKNKYGFKPSDFRQATICEETTITLPIFPGMKQNDQDYLVDNLLKSL